MENKRYIIFRVGHIIEQIEAAGAAQAQARFDEFTQLHGLDDCSLAMVIERPEERGDTMKLEASQIQRQVN